MLFRFGPAFLIAALIFLCTFAAGAALSNDQMPSDHELLAAICDQIQIIDGSCKYSIGEEAGCILDIGARYHIISDRKSFFLVDFENSCWGYADEFGGHLLYARNSSGALNVVDKFKGIRLSDSCIYIGNDPNNTVLYCLHTHDGNGTEWSLFYTFVRDGKIHGDTLPLAPPKVGLEVDSDYSDGMAHNESFPDPVDKGRSIYWVSCTPPLSKRLIEVSDMGRGPRPLTLKLKVKYLSESQTKAACDGSRPPVDETNARLGMDATIAEGKEVSGWFIYDIRERRLLQFGRGSR